MSAPTHCPRCASTELERTEAGIEPMLHCLRCGEQFRARDRLASTISARLRLVEEEPAADEEVATADTTDELVEIDETEGAQPPRVWTPPPESEADSAASDVDDDAEEGDTEELVPAIVHETSHAPRRRGGGVLRRFAGVVAGGWLGLLLGYYVLVLINGPEANFLGLALPGLPTGKVDVRQPAGGRQFEALVEGLSKSLTSLGNSVESSSDAEAASGNASRKTVESTMHVKGEEAIRSGGTQFDVAELEQAIAVLPREPVTAMDANQYRQWSRVAELLTYLQWQGTDAEALAAQQEVVQQRLERSLPGHEAASDVGRLATAWLQKPRESAGVLLVGTLQESRPSGDHWVSIVRMDETGENVATVSREPPLVAVGNPVRLLGVISFDPAGEFKGFTEPLPRAVWTALLVPGI